MRSGCCFLHANPWKWALYQGPRINRIIIEDVVFGHAPASRMGLGPGNSQCCERSLWGGVRSPLPVPQGYPFSVQGTPFLGMASSASNTHSSTVSDDPIPC